jgi:hypothetical protein
VPVRHDRNGRDRLYVRYNVYGWTPPKLSPEQEIEIGREIALHGRSKILELAPYLSERERQQIAAAKNRTATQKITVTTVAVLFFGACRYVIASNRALLVPFLIALFAIGGFSLTSLLGARAAYRKWVDEMLAKYAAHTAGMTSKISD